MSERPLLLLDVDGPLNPYGASRGDVDKHRLPLPYYVRRMLGYRVFLSKVHGPLLTAFAAEHDVELAWATTWEHDANRLIGPFIGLPQLPVIEFGRHPGTIKGWKYPAVLKHAAGRPVAWLDDDFHTAAHHTAKTEFLASRSGLLTVLHHIDPHHGLVQADLDTVAAALAGGPSQPTEEPTP